MAFPDPQTLTINGIAHLLARVAVGDRTATYQTADETVKMRITHTINKAGRVSTVVRVEQRKIVTNPLDSSSDYDVCVLSLLLDRPSYGWTATEISHLTSAIEAWLDATSVGKLYGQES